MSLFESHFIFYIYMSCVIVSLMFWFWFLWRHIEVPAIFEDPNSLKEVNVWLSFVFDLLLWVCKILWEIYICLFGEGEEGI